MFRRLLRVIMTSPATPPVPIPTRGVDFRGKVVLAPMVRSGELPSRLLALHYGADLVWGPETIDRSIIGTTRSVNARTGCIEFSRMPSNGGLGSAPPPRPSIIYRIDPAHEGGRLIYQMGTCRPDLAVQAARVVAADVAGIDVNAGCPKSFSTDGGMGAALLATPDTLCAILEALVADIVPAFQIGISVKIRILPDAAATEALVRRLVRTGITGLTVHCRTKTMRPRERALRDQLPMVRAVCHEAGVACVVNGDVASRDHARELMATYGVDAAMIATAAEKNPSCFRAVADGGLAAWPEIVDAYLRHAIRVGNRFGNTKYLLAQLVPGRYAEQVGMMRGHSYADVCAALGLAHLMDDAHATDAALGIDPASLRRAKDEAERLKAERKAEAKAAKAAAASAAAEATTAETTTTVEATTTVETTATATATQPRPKSSAVAAAAGGNMAEARAAEQTKRSLSERGVSSTAATTTAAMATSTATPAMPDTPASAPTAGIAV